MRVRLPVSWPDRVSNFQTAGPPAGQFGTHLSRGAISYIAYRWNGREYRESTRSTERRVAERLLASRVADGRGRGHHGPLTFDHRAVWYLDDYLVRRLRTVDTARGRVANLRATFGGQPATEERRELYRYGHSRRLGHRDGRHRGVSAVVVLSAVAPRGPRTDQARAALTGYGPRVCPATLGSRAAVGDAGALQAFASA